MTKASDTLTSTQIINKGHDFWGLGILIYELLYGVTPFQQENQEDTMSMILNAEVCFPGMLKSL